MDRRDFLKTLLAAPLVSSLAGEIPASPRNCEIGLIADDPHLFLDPLLDSVSSTSNPFKRTYCFTDPHPEQHRIGPRLIGSGWTPSSRGEADLRIACGRLSAPAAPSFTLVKNDRILDPRTDELRSLWLAMQSSGRTSRLLTTATFRPVTRAALKGDSVSVYARGRLRARLPLDRSRTRSFEGKMGTVKVCIEDGQARVIESSCRHRVCLSIPSIGRTGDRIVCAPNNVLLEITGGRGGVDTVIG